MSGLVAFVAGTALAGAAGTAAFDYGYIKHLNAAESERAAEFRKLHPAVLAHPGDVLPSFPEDPGVAPEVRQVRDRNLKIVLLAVPTAALLAGLLLARKEPVSPVGSGIAYAGAGGLLVNLYLVLGGPLPIGAIK